MVGSCGTNSLFPSLSPSILLPSLKLQPAALYTVEVTFRIHLGLSRLVDFWILIITTLTQ